MKLMLCNLNRVVFFLLTYVKFYTYDFVILLKHNLMICKKKIRMSIDKFLTFFVSAILLLYYNIIDKKKIKSIEKIGVGRQKKLHFLKLTF